MHTEHLQNVRSTNVAMGWLVAVAVAAGVFLLFAALGLAPEDAGGAAIAAIALAAGFATGGFVAGFRSMHAPILHGLAIGLTSLVAWFFLNIVTVALVPATTWTGVTPVAASGLLLEQIAAAIAGAWLGHNTALKGQPEPEE